VVDVVWQTQPGGQTEFERQYVEAVLLAQVDHRFIFDERRFEHRPPGGVVVLSHDAQSLPRDLRSYLAGCPNVVLLHLSGENLPSVEDAYGDVRAVMRSYYDPRLSHDPLFTMPLGFKSGLMNTADVAPATDRAHAWFFAGQPKSHRQRMIHALSSLTPHKVHLTSGWGSDDSLDLEAMRRYLGDAVFVPCPFGNVNPDSFRIMEALEFGAIPVCVRFMGVDYYRYVFGDHPFLVADDWASAAVAMRALLEDPSALDARQSEVRAWYRTFKDDLARDVRAIVDGRYDDVASKQFVYQRQGQEDALLKHVFELRFGRSLASRVYREAPFLYAPTLWRMRRADQARRTASS
jgi:hypothetical protein